MFTKLLFLLLVLQLSTIHSMNLEQSSPSSPRGPLIPRESLARKLATSSDSDSSNSSDNPTPIKMGTLKDQDTLIPRSLGKEIAQEFLSLNTTETVDTFHELACFCVNDKYPMSQRAWLTLKDWLERRDSDLNLLLEQEGEKLKVQELAKIVIRSMCTVNSDQTKLTISESPFVK